MDVRTVRALSLIKHACRGRSIPSPSVPGSGSSLPEILRVSLEQVAADTGFSRTQIFLWAEEELARDEK